MTRRAVLPGLALLLAAAAAPPMLISGEWPGGAVRGRAPSPRRPASSRGGRPRARPGCKADLVGGAPPPSSSTAGTRQDGGAGQKVDMHEVVACFDAGTGKLGEHRLDVYNTTVPFNRVGWASLVADPETGNVYAHGVAACWSPWTAPARSSGPLLTEELGFTRAIRRARHPGHHPLPRIAPSSAPNSAGLASAVRLR